jgi:hypothetical protein
VSFRLKKGKISQKEEEGFEENENPNEQKKEHKRLDKNLKDQMC